MNIENLKFEKKLVHNTYDQIANKFNLTRLYIWPCVKTFLNSLNNNDLIADIGCGSGRNLSIIGQKHDNNDIDKKIYTVGMDICKELVSICKDKEFEVISGDSLMLPFKNNYFNATMSVAVIHHIHTDKRRKQAIMELIRITKPGGKIFVTAWGYEEFDKFNKSSKKTLVNKDNSNPQDTLISWNNKGKILQRYYHLFIKGELENLFFDCGVKKENIESYNQRGNWIITAMC